MDVELQRQILSGLRCKLCSNYMKSAIFTCQSGHSICNKCEENNETCSCSSSITKSRNFAMESMAMKISFPCINARGGCKEFLPREECLQHELVCTMQINFACVTQNCTWKGNYEDILHHWKSKRINRPYGSNTACHTKLRNDKVFINLVRAYGQLFWYIFRSHNDIFYWNIQYIGSKVHARNYYFDITFNNLRSPKQRMIFGNYCQPARDENREEHTFAVAVPFKSAAKFLKKDLIYFQFNVYKIDDDNGGIKSLTESRNDSISSLQSNVPEGLLIDFGENNASNLYPNLNSIADSSIQTNTDIEENITPVEYHLPAQNNIPNSLSNDIPPLMSLTIPAPNLPSTSCSADVDLNLDTTCFMKGPDMDKLKDKSDTLDAHLDQPSTSTYDNSDENGQPRAYPRRKKSNSKEVKNKTKKKDEECSIL